MTPPHGLRLLQAETAPEPRRPLRVGFDIDDVLYPWYGRAHLASTQAGITNGVDPVTWSPYIEYGCTAGEWYDALAVATITGDLYNGDPFPGVTEQLARVHDAGHTIHLVTARGFMAHGDLIRHTTVRWLETHQIPHDSLTFAKDKRAVVTDLFLDDAPHNYDQLDEHTEVWLAHAPHNGPHRDARRSIATLAGFVDAVLARGRR